MTKPEFGDELFLKYLRLLRIQRQKPGFEYLKEIVLAQGSIIPFENISKLFYKKRLNLKHLIDFELYLEGIEKYNFGGTCYSQNYYLNLLFTWLGYDVKLCGADMKDPDVHLINIVNIERREFLIDTGYAAPFSVPLPLDLTHDYTINMGLDRYVLKPRNANNRSQIMLYRNEEIIHGYSINSISRNIGEFREAIENSFKESATFMNALLLTRLDKDKFIVIHNRTITESKEKKIRKYMTDSNEQLAVEVKNHFGIPITVFLESIDGLQMQKSGWS